MGAGQTMALQMVLSLKDNATSGLKSPMGALKDLAGAALKLAGPVVGIAALTKGMKDSIAAASDLGETINKVSVVFGSQADAVLKFGESAATALGMSKNEALAAAGTYGNLFRSMGMAEGMSAQMSTSLVQLAADLASFNNIDPSEALEKLRAGLTGETEPLKSLGVNLNEATIKAKAMELGLYSGKGALDASAKAQAAYAMIMEQTTLAQGDFARTSDGLANQQRILAATFTDIKAIIGSALLPIINKLAGALVKLLQNEKLQKGLKALSQGIADITNALGWLFKGDWATGLELIVNGIFGLGEAFGVNRKTLESFAKVLYDIVPTFMTSFQRMRALGLDPFSAALVAVGDVLERFIPPSLMNSIWSVIGGLQDLAGALGALLQGDVLSFWEQFTGALGLFVQAVTEYDWAGLAQLIGSMLRETWDAAVLWLTTNLPRVLQQIGAFIQSAWEQGTKWAKDRISEAIGTIGEIATNLFTGLPGKIGELAGQVGAFLQGVWSDAVEWVRSNLADIPDRLAGVATDLWERVKTFLANLPGIVESIGGFLADTWSKAVDWVKTNIGPTADKLAGVATDLWEQVKILVANLPEIAQSIGTFLQTHLIAGVEWVSNNIQPAGQALSGIFSSLIDTLQTFVDSNRDNWAGQLGQKLLNMLYSAKDWLDQNTPGIAASFGLVVDKIEEEGFVQYVQQNTDSWAQQIALAWEGLHRSAINALNIDNLIPSLAEWANKLIDGMESTLTNANGEVIGKALADFMLGAFMIFIKIITAPSALAKIVGEAIGTIIRNAIGQAGEKAEPDFKLITGLFNLLKGIWLGAMKEMRDKLAVPLTDAMVGLVSSAVNGMAQKANEFIDQAFQVGRNIVLGMINGVTSAVGELIAAVRGAIGSAISAALGALHEHSPSLVFRDIGLNIGAGLVMGIDQSTGPVQRAVEGLVGSGIVAPFQADFGGMLAEIARLVEQLLAVFPDAAKVESAKGRAEMLVSLANAVQAVVAAIGAIAEYHANRALKALPALMRDLAGVLEGLQQMSAGFKQETLDKAAAAMEAVGKLVAPVRAAVDALAAIGAYSAGMELAKRWQMLQQDLRLVVHWMIGIADLFSAEAVAAAAVFAESAGKIFAPLKSVVDGLNAIASYEHKAGLAQLWHDVQYDMRMVVNWMVGIAELYRGQAVEAAGAFASSVGQIMAPLKGVVDALEAIGSYEHAAGLADTWHTLQYDMRMVVNWLQNIAVLYDQKAVEAAAEFMAAVGKLLQPLKTAVDALTAIGEYTHIDGLKWAIRAFYRDLLVVVDQLIGIQYMYDSKAAEAAAALMASIGKIVQPLKSAVDALVAVGGYTAQQNLAAAIGAFQGDLAEVVTRLMSLTAFFDQTATEAAGALLAAMGKVVQPIKSAVDALNALGAYVGQQNMGVALTAFELDLREVISQFLVFTEVFDAEATDAAAAVLAAIGKLVQPLKTAVDALNALGAYVGQKDIEAALIGFELDLREATTQMLVFAEVFDANATEAASAVLAAIGKLVQPLKTAVDALNALRDYVGTTSMPAAMAAFAIDLRAAVDMLISVAGDFAGRGVDAAAELMTYVGQIVAPVKTAVDSLTALGGYASAKGLAAGLAQFKKDLTTVVNDLLTFTAGLDPTALQSIADVMALVSAISTPLSGVTKMLADLSGYKALNRTTFKTFIADLSYADDALAAFGASFSPEVAGQIRDWAESMFGIGDWIIAVGTRWASEVVSAATLWRTSVEKATQAIAYAMGALESLRGMRVADLYNIGYALGSNWVRGIVDGILSGVHEVAGAVDQALAPMTKVVNRNQPVVAGMGYAAGGGGYGGGPSTVVIQMTYSPTISLATKEEAMTHMVPAVTEALRRAGIKVR